VGRSLLESCDAKEMLAYQHSCFSVDAGVCLQAHNRAGLERLLRCCARRPFSMERPRQAGGEPASDKRGAKVDELQLTPLELLERVAALVPPPRTHRHRYFGLLAANSPLRAAMTTIAQAPERTSAFGCGAGRIEQHGSWRVPSSRVRQPSHAHTRARARITQTFTSPRSVG